MKLKLTLALCTSLLTASFFLSHQSTAQTPTSHATQQVADNILNPQAPQQIRIYVEMIEISALEYADLMTTPTNSNNHTALRTKLLAMVNNDKAKLVLNQSLVARSGEKATVESIEEFIYPTEFEPAETIRPTKTDTAEQVLEFPVLPPTPTAFEQRNLGYTLELEPSLADDGMTVDLRFAPEAAKFVGEHVYSKWKTPSSETEVKMPTIYTQRINTAFTLISGQFLLAGTFSPETEGKVDHSRKVLTFVRAEVLRVESPQL